MNDRVPASGKEGYRKFTVVDAGTSGLTIGMYFTAKVEFADEATQAGTLWAKANVATDAIASAGVDDSAIMTPRAVKKSIDSTAKSLNLATSIS